MFCQVHGIRLFYEAAGSGSPVVLLHGNGESHAIFDVLMQELQKTHRVYAPDSRCHGQSTDTPEITYDAMAADVIAFIRQLGLEKPILYGFSDGGIVGLLAAMKEPQLLGKLLISGANLKPRGLTPWTGFTTRLMALTGKKLWRLMAEQPPIDPADLGRITVPTVVLAGQHDVIRRSHTELIARSIPGSVLRIVPHEGHGSYIVHSPKLYPILKEYL